MNEFALIARVRYNLLKTMQQNRVNRIKFPLIWVPGHECDRENTKANVLAKFGAKIKTTSLETIVRIRNSLLTTD